MTHILLATRNRKKLAELQRILAEAFPEVDVIGLDDVAQFAELPETEATFADNALLKARSACAATGLLSIADDSGLCVDALNGMPGVLSARWAGVHGDDVANLELVLAQLVDVADSRRLASFHCAAAAVYPDGLELVFEATMPGRLIRNPRGDRGFGYDPAFVAEGKTLTNAELDPAEKDAISHRGQALRALVVELVRRDL